MRCGAPCIPGPLNPAGEDPARRRPNGPGFKKKKPAATYFPPERSIIGAGVLDFRVRNGNGYIHPTMATGITKAAKMEERIPGGRHGPARRKESPAMRGNEDMARAHDLLVPLGCARRRACTCGLSTR